ncbi:MAG: FtsQ-type POTRA domain-containing protein [Pyrinomonadaceae bacterium]
MREQVVIPRSGRNAGAASTQKKWRAVDAAAQKPARRPRGNSTASASSGKLKIIVALMPIVGKILLVVVACVLAVSFYRMAASAKFFQLRRIDVSGTHRSSGEDIQAIVRRKSANGVWKTDLDAISDEIKRRQGWVRNAAVTRVLPDGMRVRVAERNPRAVLRSASGRLVWLDEEAVVLGEVSPAMPQLPAFFVHGFDESGTEAARRDNKERIAKYLEMSREWEAAGLSERLSEVNLMDVRDVRAQLAGRDARIEVRLGRDDFGQRLRRALAALDEGRDSPRGAAITYIDTTLYPKVTLGFSAGAHDNAAATTARR